MRVERVMKQSFTVIGIEGSTNDGSDFTRAFHPWENFSQYVLIELY